MDLSLREHWLERDGIRLFATEAGQGPPLVLLHGGLANHLACWLFAAPLVSEFRIITPDLRGAGRSHFAGQLTWDAIADDVAAIVRALGVERCAIGGISFGAGAAVRVALRHRELVSSLLVLHPAYGGDELGLAPAQQQAMAAMNAYGSRVVAEGIDVMLPLFDALPEPVRARAKRLVATYDPASVATTTAFMASLVQPFARGAELAAIDVPALVVPGVDAQHPREVADVFAAHLPQPVVRDAEAAQLSTVIADFMHTAVR